jgi:hypothetical protein
VVARPSEPPAFTPTGQPRVAIAGDGSLAAISEASRVVVVELPGGAAFAEVGTDPEAVSEVVWVGARPRLLVLSRYTAHSTVHLIDPHGPRTVAEIRLEAPMKLFASVGAHALAVGLVGAAVLSTGDSHLTPFQFPARTIPVTAGAAAGNFVVALAGSIEEWDPASRMPKRRLRLPKPAVITAVGGSDRVVWMMTQSDPRRIDVMPLVNRGQPKFHDLPEAIAQVSGHPRSDLLTCIGADSGKLYVVDLDGRHRLRTLGTGVIDRAGSVGMVVGRMVGVLAAQLNKPIAVIALDPRETEGDTQVTQVPPGVRPAEPAPARSSLVGDDDDDAPAPAVSARSTLVVEADHEPAVPVAAPAPPRVAPSPKPEPAPPPPAPLQDRFSPWREKMRQSQLRAEQATALPWSDPHPTWRDDLVTWARGVAAGSPERAAPAAAALDTIAARFDLPAQLVPAIALLYGTHLSGVLGAAPVDVARVLGRRWDEALGTGQLALRGLARYADSRVVLAPPVQRMLDELPVTTGTLVGEPGTVALLGPCVVVAGDVALAVLAERYLAAIGGAILAAFDDIEPAELFVEARARGAAPMLRIGTGEILQVGTDPAVLVVGDEATADQLGVPRI